MGAIVRSECFFSGKPGGMFPRPRLKGSWLLSRHSLDGVFDHRHPAITNRLEGFSHCRGHWRRCANPNETLDGRLRGHIYAGAGVALLAQSVVRADVEQGRLIRVLPDWEPEPVELHALYPSRLNSSPKVRAFLQFLRERFGGEPLLDGQED
jgi:DNA-binding transcriptional LysR family regulator